MTPGQTIGNLEQREQAIRRICMEASETAESIYAFLEAAYPAPPGVSVDHGTLAQPISALAPGTVLALGDVVSRLDDSSAGRLVATLSERFEAELTDWSRVPNDREFGRLHVLVLGLYLSVVLIPVCRMSGRRERATSLTLLFTQQMTSSGYDRIPIAGGDGFGESTLAILMLPLAALASA